MKERERERERERESREYSYQYGDTAGSAPKIQQALPVLYVTSLVGDDTPTLDLVCLVDWPLSLSK